MTCHNCKINAGKFGFHNGYQRYRCKQCGKTFSDIPASPIGDMRISPAQVYQVVHLLCEGVGIRAIERLTGLARYTVLGVVEMAGIKAAKLLDARLRNLTVQHMEIDEVFGFVGCLQQNTEREGDEERGDQYAFLAIEATTKLIAHWHVGKRTNYEAMTFVEGLAERVTGRFQITSDEYRGYMGTYGAVEMVFGTRIDYATELKVFAQLNKSGTRFNNPVVCKLCKRTRQLGRPNLDRATTNHAERNNLSVRLFSRRFTRKTINYSKKLENHRHAVALHVAHFNFCRTHSAHGKTPAQAQGLTDHRWTIEELITNAG